NMIFDLGTNAAGFVLRNGNGTVNFGAVMGGVNTVLSGHTSGSGTVTYSIGAKGLSTQFDGNIVETNKGATGPVALTLVGGSLRLTGTSNVYTGASTINGGTLQVDGLIIKSGVTVGSGSGGVLTGNGLIGGAVEIGSGSTFIPGDGTGVLSISN